MRYGPNDKSWVVVDPTSDSTMDDILFQASLKDLDLRFKGCPRIEENPTRFTDDQEAKYEAFGRLTAMRAGQAILRAGRENPDTRPRPSRFRGGRPEVRTTVKVGSDPSHSGDVRPYRSLSLRADRAGCKIAGDPACSVLRIRRQVQ